MIVLVAGGTGFLGSRVVDLLKQKGHNVIIYHRSLRAVPTQADVIINCVGIIRERNQTFEEAHVDVTAFLAGLGKKLGVKQFVQVSAIGANPHGTAYQRTKAKAEGIVERSGLNYAIIRPSIIFGPGDESINRFRSIASTGFFPLLANSRVQPIHVDVVAKVILAAARRRIRNRIAEIGGPEVFTYAQLADRIHPGVHIIRIPGWAISIVTSLGALIPLFPTREMVRMMREDNVTDEKTVERLDIHNTALTS